MTGSIENENQKEEVGEYFEIQVFHFSNIHSPG